jgi:hypothetical protein
MWISKRQYVDLTERMAHMSSRIIQLENDVKVDYGDASVPMLSGGVHYVGYGYVIAPQSSIKVNTLIKELAEKLGYTIKKNVVHKEEYLEKIEKGRKQYDDK